MGGARDIKGRIKSVRNIQQITKAMKMVASARIKKAETRMRAARPFAYKLQEVVAELIAQVDEVTHPLMGQRPARRVAVVVVSADKGLCGAYNGNVLKVAMTFLAETPSEEPIRIIPVGSKAVRFFSRRQMRLENDVVGWNPEFDLAKKLAEKVSGLFISGDVDEVHCVYTKSVSTMVQQVTTTRLLPLAPPEVRPRPVPYIFEPDAATVLETLLPRHLEVLLYQILLESRTSELGARLRAMTNATDNAEKLAGELTLQYFRARQASITNEILEVSSGAEALKK